MNNKGGTAPALISVILPGVGQMMNGKFVIGILLFILISFFYLTLVLAPFAFILHVLALIDAYQGK